MKNVQKRLVTTLCVLFTLLMIPGSVKADTGPKPSVNVTVDGISGERYYATLLSEEESTGPASVYDGTNAYYTDEIPNAEELWQKFQDYQDTDGYYFLQWFWDCSTDNAFQWGYYPPERFKILFYFPEYDSYVVSNVQERYAFDSYYTVDLADVDYRQGGTVDCSQTGNVKRSYDYRDEILSLLARIFITIAVEIVIAVLFQLRGKKQLLFIGLVNGVTQILLNMLLNLAAYTGGAKWFVLCYFLLELLVTLIEAILYVRYMPENDKDAQMTLGSATSPSNCKLVVYALVANIASYIIGYYIAKILPGIF